MKHENLLPFLSLMLIALFLVACGASVTPSESGLLVDGATLASPVDTPTSVPPTVQPRLSVAVASTSSIVDTPTPVPPTVQPYEIVRDIPYQKEGSEYAQERGKLDMYLPKGRVNYPVLVWFHGGALMYESKEEFYATSVAKRLASEGVGVVLPNYRLFPGVKYPTYIEDAASAVAWVYHNIATYQGDPEQLFVGGHSSGAYLAAMTGMDERYLKPHQLSAEQIAGVIALSGEMYGDSTVWGERGIVKTNSKDEASPMSYVRRDAPRFLCLCAEISENPPTVCQENREFTEALQAAGNQNVMFEQIPGRTHFSISEMKTPDDPVVKLVLSFIQKAGSEK